MPFTKEKFIIKENAALVAWERVTREFLRQLSVRHAHRVSAVMVFEWATGRTVKEHLANGGSTTDLKIGGTRVMKANVWSAANKRVPGVKVKLRDAAESKTPPTPTAAAK